MQETLRGDNLQGEGIVRATGGDLDYSIHHHSCGVPNDRGNLVQLINGLNDDLARLGNPDRWLPLPDEEVHGAQDDQEDIPLQLVLDNAVRMFGDEASAKGLSLSAEPTAVIAVSQPVALIRIVSNLVANAIKYTEAGEVTLAVRVEEGQAAIDVQDTGPGMTEAQVSTVLQPYARGDGVDGIEGEGLGLSSVKGLADEQGLRLEVESTPGQGSRFTIAGLPID